MKPLINRLHREFNLSVAEIDLQDRWDETIIGCAVISNDRSFAESMLQNVQHWLNKNWPDVTLMDDQMEIID